MLSLGIGLAVPLARSVLGASAPSSFTVLSSGGSPYTAPLAVLASDGTSYTVTRNVLSSGGTSYAC